MCHVLPAIEAGATGQLLKDAPRDDLLRVVRATARGEAVLAPSAAARLFLTEATMKSHLLNIYAKLGVNDRASAVGEAFKRGLLVPRTPEQPGS